jgi:N6-adenosine-specific RNA methylase IME4
MTVPTPEGHPSQACGRKFHPLANIFPLLEGEEFEQLVTSIGASGGPRDSIVIHEGMILDGRNRARACEAAGITPFFKPYEGDDPVAYVVDLNLKRRHLNDDQRRMVAAKLANMGRGRPSDNPAECGIKVTDAARMANVDEAGTERARTVLAKATPEIQTAVERGKLSVSAAAQAAKFKPEKQSQIAAEAEAGRANVVRTVIKQEARAGRERELGERQLAGPEGKFGVIVEDYEWDHETWSEAGRDRAAENHYPVSRDAHTAAEIVERTKDRFACAADDCVCFMWATLQHLAIAIDVLRQRGFEYKSSYAWGKDKIGLGYWSREKHEILLIGVKGNIACPAPGTQWDSLVMAPRTEHSAKPECFLEMIEQYFPTLPKIELNRRGPARKGWKQWGFEAEEQPDEQHSVHVAAPTVAIGPPAPPDDYDDLALPTFLRRDHPDCPWRDPVE